MAITLFMTTLIIFLKIKREIDILNYLFKDHLRRPTGVSMIYID